MWLQTISCRWLSSTRETSDAIWERGDGSLVFSCLQKPSLISPQVCPCRAALYFECSEMIMLQRLLNRGKSSGRVDDNETTFNKRMRGFREQTMPVIDYLHTKDKVITVRAIPLYIAQSLLRHPDWLWRPTDRGISWNKASLGGNIYMSCMLAVHF